MHIGRYEIKGQIGQGGMGQVLLGLDPVLGREVAIKVMQGGGNAEEEQRFLREAQTVSRLNHPGIVTVYEMGREAGRLFIAMELVEGISLKQLISAGQPPTRADLHRNLLLFRQVLEAMAYAHDQHIVHRDLKPDNIMVTKAGQAKVLDFGLAFFSGNHSLTMTGEVGLGTPSYVAPEQIKDFAHTDARADIYSLGVILYEIVTGQCPFSAPNTVALIYQVVSAEPQPPRALYSSIPTQLEALILRMLRKNAADRFASLREVLPLYDNACGFEREEVEQMAVTLPASGKYQALISGIVPMVNQAASGTAFSPVPAPMVACPHCQGDNRPGYKFCNHCGRPAIPPCPHCGNTSNRLGASFCNACGQALGGGLRVGTPGRNLLRGLEDIPESGTVPEPEFEYLKYHRDYLTLGSYPQEDGSYDSPVEWMVLERRDSRLLVVSRYGLDCGRYYSARRGEGVAWANCTLRRWLEEEFFYRIFDEAERALVLPARYGEEDGFAYGDEAEGRVFLLSIAEASQFFLDDLERCCQPTAYARSEGAYARSNNDQYNGNGWWWLRSAGTEDMCAACVHDGGVINDRGRPMRDGDLCIRPALYLSCP